MSQTYAGPYAHMKFPPYVFKEYPKWITREDGKRMLVKNQQEEIQNQMEVIDGKAQIADPVVRERDALAGQVALFKSQGEAKDLLLAEMQARLAKLENGAKTVTSTNKLETPTSPVKPPVKA